MSTRLTFRPRPVDVNKQLQIVRSIDDLDTENAVLTKDGLPVQELLNDVKQEKGDKKSKRGKEIPVPEVRSVPTYEYDYLPLFEIPPTYIRGKGTASGDEEEVEYDLDNEDEDWLAAYNGDQSRIPPDKFEEMLWTLELACAAANDRTMTAAGASHAEKNTAAAVGAVDHLRKEEAIDLLRKSVGGRDIVLEHVYQYWLAKRRRWGKPILRRLQAPTSISDINPFNVFRPREKVNRPQTRRRRENSEECLEKLRMLRENQRAAQDLLELILKREKKKHELVVVEVESQKLQVSLCHSAPQTHHALEEAAKQGVQQALSGLHQPNTPASQPPLLRGNSSLILQHHKTSRRRSQQDEDTSLAPDMVVQFPSPPPSPEMELPLALELSQEQIDLVRQSITLPPGVDWDHYRPRLGRHRRLILEPIGFFDDEEDDQVASGSLWPPLPEQPVLRQILTAGLAAMDIIPPSAAGGPAVSEGPSQQLGSGGGDRGALSAVDKDPITPFANSRADSKQNAKKGNSGGRAEGSGSGHRRGPGRPPKNKVEAHV